jgi:bacteriocin-like protein
MNVISKIDELNDAELDAVSGGDKQKEQENQEQLKALETFGKALQKAGQI